jgi:hypothetical protein
VPEDPKLCPCEQPFPWLEEGVEQGIRWCWFRCLRCAGSLRDTGDTQAENVVRAESVVRFACRIRQEERELIRRDIRAAARTVLRSRHQRNGHHPRRKVRPVDTRRYSSK